MNEFRALEMIEKENSTNKKIEILTSEMDDKLEEYFRMTFGDVILNVASKTIENALEIKSPIKHRDIGERLEWWLKNNSKQSSLLAFSGIQEHNKNYGFSDFKRLFEELQGLRGNESEAKLKEFFENCNPENAKWFARCIIKNLSCGVSWTTVNKVFKKLGKKEIETFDLSLCSLIDCTTEDKMHAQLSDISEKDFYNDGGELIEGEHIWVEPKYDGVRLIVRNAILGRKKKTHALSRNGKTIESVPSLLAEFDRVFGEMKIELDGELIAKDFQTLMTQVHRKNDLSTTMPREYMVFDILSLNGNDMTYLPYTKRRETLEKLFSNFSSETIKLVKNKIIDSTQGIIDMFKQSVSAGYEGVIVKINRPYTRDRTVWWKMKPVLTADLEIVGLEQGSGRHAGKIAVLTVRDASGKVTSRVGSGLSDEVITQMNKAKDYSSWLGKIVEVRYDSITKPNSYGLRSLRFPRFVRFRFDKEKAEVL